MCWVTSYGREKSRANYNRETTMNGDGDRVVATTGPFAWTHDRANIAYWVSNVIGFVAASFLLSVAIDHLNKPRKDLMVSMVIFPALLTFDYAIKYPLSVKIDSIKWKLIVFIAYYFVISCVLLYPFVKGYLALYVLLYGVLLAAFLALTHPAAKMPPSVSR